MATTKEVAKRLLKGLGTCPNCRYGIRMEFFTLVKANGGRWVVEKDVYDCLKREKDFEINRNFCEIEWERLNNQPSKEYVTSSLNDKFAIRFIFDRNLLSIRRFRKRIDDLRCGARGYLKWKEESEDKS